MLWVMLDIVVIDVMGVCVCIEWGNITVQFCAFMSDNSSTIAVKIE